MHRFLLVLSLCVAVFCQQWVQRASMPTARSDMYANAIGNLIYVVAGCVIDQTAYGDGNCPVITNVLEIYDPVSNSWSTGLAASVKRYRHSTARVGTQLWVTSGRDENDTAIASTEVYDTVAKTWTNRTPLPSWALTSDGYAWAIGTTLYHAGGYYQNYTAASLVVSLDTTNVNATWQVVPGALNTARGDHCASVIQGIPYVFGGFNDLIGFNNPLSSAEAYSNNQWSYKAPFPTGRGDSAEGIVTINGITRFLVIGGEAKTADGNPLPITDVHSYEPNANAWRLETPLPVSFMRFAGDGLNSTVYVFGGQRAGLNANGTSVFKVFNSTYSLDLGTQQTTVAPTTATPTPTTVTTKAPTSTPGTASTYHASFLLLLLVLFY